MTRAGVMMASLHLLLQESCLDIALQCHDIVLIDVDELYAYMENILGKSFRMYDSGPDIERQTGLRRWLQVELDLDHNARDLSGGSLILRQDLIDSVTPAAEIETAGRQIDDHGGKNLPLWQTHCSRDLCVKPEELSFFPVHVSLAGILLSGIISLRIHFLILSCRNMGVNLGICASNVKLIARARLGRVCIASRDACGQFRNIQQLQTALWLRPSYRPSACSPDSSGRVGAGISMDIISPAVSHDRCDRSGLKYMRLPEPDSADFTGFIVWRIP
jgi:hypothetical protein